MKKSIIFKFNKEDKDYKIMEVDKQRILKDNFYCSSYLLLDNNTIELLAGPFDLNNVDHWDFIETSLKARISFLLEVEKND